jgi:hypothetical protein
MSAKFLAIGTIAGGIFIFLWGAITHAVLPQPMAYFKDEAAVMQAVRANTAGNGIYFGPKGVFASVALAPDSGDKTQNIAPNLITQLVTDMISAFLLCLLLGGLRAESTSGRASWLLLAGLASFTVKFLLYWNWYGFPPAFVGMELLDLVGKFFLGGLVLAALQKRLAPQQV